VQSPTASYSGGPGFKYRPRDCLPKGISCSFSGQKAIAGTESDHNLWPHCSTLITTWGHIQNSYRSTTSTLCSSCYASLSVLLYIRQSVHINMCTDNNMISPSRYKCCQLFHMCRREIQQPTYRRKSWIPPSPTSTAFLACPQYNHLLLNAEYSRIMPVSLNVS